MNGARLMLGDRPVNPVGLGCMNICWAYGPAVEEDYAARLLNQALDLGYDHLDTARIYGLGQSEEWIGRALKNRRHEYYLASKTGIMIDGPTRGIDCSPATARTALEESLRLLQTDHIDLYYFHRFDPNIPIADSIGAMAAFVQEGKIGGIGVSEWSAAHIREAHAVHPITAVQTEYSLMTRNPEIAVLDTCRELGITFVAFSPVARGFLTGSFGSEPNWVKGDLRNGWPRFNDPDFTHNMKLIAPFHAIATEEGVTPAQLSLGWVLAQGDHVVTIPGTQNIAHLEENIARWDYRPSHAICARLDRLINHHSVVGHRYGAAMRPTIDTEDFPDG